MVWLPVDYFQTQLIDGFSKMLGLSAAYDQPKAVDPAQRPSQTPPQTPPLNYTVAMVDDSNPMSPASNGQLAAASAAPWSSCFLCGSDRYFCCCWSSRDGISNSHGEVRHFQVLRAKASIKCTADNFLLVISSTITATAPKSIAIFRYNPKDESLWNMVANDLGINAPSLWWNGPTRW